MIDAFSNLSSNGIDVVSDAFGAIVQFVEDILSAVGGVFS